MMVQAWVSLCNMKYKLNLLIRVYNLKQATHDMKQYTTKRDQ